MKNRKLLSSISVALIFGSVFAASFGIARALQIKSADDASFNIGTAPEEVKTKIYYQSSFFYGGEGTVYAYAWDSKNTSNFNAAYPGIAMTAEDYRHGLYSYEVSDKFDKIIFNAGDIEADPTKTDDLTIDRTNVYYCQHQDTWDASLDDCTFSYYLVGNLNGVDTWGANKYENGLLKNYAGGKVTEYMKADYTFALNDSFKIIDEGRKNWYGIGGTTSGGDYLVHTANSSSTASAFVYFTAGSSLYAGSNFHFHNTNKMYGEQIYCHMWYKGGTGGTTWPGSLMTREDQNYWYSVMVDINYNSVIFNNKGAGGDFQTADLDNIDASKPYYEQGWKASK